MKPNQRQRLILDRVDRDGEAMVDALSDTFGVSAETIRRDLVRLAATGALIKMHGVARRLRHHPEGSFEEREADEAAAKATIAQKVKQEVVPGQTLFIDTGTTTLACARVLAEIEGLTVVTNSVRIAQVLSEKGGRTRLHLLGGRYAAGNAETVGPETIEHIERFRADIAILSVTCLDPVAGGTDADFDEAQVARAMRRNARRCILVAHFAKFGRSAPHRICRLDEVDVIVSERGPDTQVPSAILAALNANKVALR